MSAQIPFKIIFTDKTQTPKGTNTITYPRNKFPWLDSIFFSFTEQVFLYGSTLGLTGGKTVIKGAEIHVFKVFLS